MHEADAVAVSADTQVEAAEPVAAERIRATLEDDCGGLEGFDGGSDDGLKDVRVSSVIDSRPQGDVDGVIAAALHADLVNVPGPGEESVAVLVKGEGHDPAVPVEGFLHAVPVVDVNVNVQDPRIVSEQFEHGEDNVVDVAEPGSPGAFGVVQAAGPVDCHAVRGPECQFPCPCEAPSRVKPHEAGEPRKGRAIRSEVEPIERREGGSVFHLLRQVAFSVHCPAHPVNEGNVFGAVELEEICRGGGGWDGTVHVLVEPVPAHQGIGEGEALRLHGVRRAVVEIRHIGVVEIGDTVASFPEALQVVQWEGRVRRSH